MALQISHLVLKTSVVRVRYSVDWAPPRGSLLPKQLHLQRPPTVNHNLPGAPQHWAHLKIKSNGLCDSCYGIYHFHLEFCWGETAKIRTLKTVLTLKIMHKEMLPGMGLMPVIPETGGCLWARGHSLDLHNNIQFSQNYTVRPCCCVCNGVCERESQRKIYHFSCLY